MSTPKIEAFSVRHRRACGQLGSFLLATLVLLIGCATVPDEVEDRPLTKDELRVLLAGAKDPRTLWITVYEGKAGPVFDNVFRVRENQGAFLPMLGAEGEPPRIEVAGARSEEMPALLDPSSPDSWTTVSASAQLTTTPLGPPYYQVEPGHLETEDLGFLVQASVLKAGAVWMDAPLLSVRGATGGLEAFARGAEDPEPVLVLGNDFLRAFRFVQFNFPKRRVVLSTSDPYRADERTLLARLPLYSIAGAVGTEATVNGRKTTVLLDPAGTYGVAAPKESMQSSYDVRLSGLFLPEQPGASSESLGLKASDYPRLGLRALERYIVTLDYHRKLIWFERPPL